VEPHRGTLILVLGIIGFFILPFVLGPIAWVLGRSDLKKIRAGQMDPAGESNTNAGRICGIIATIYGILNLLLIAVAIAFALFMSARAPAPRPVPTPIRPLPTAPAMPPPPRAPFQNRTILPYPPQIDNPLNGRGLRFTHSPETRSWPGR
jgi:hypothetical protein